MHIGVVTELAAFFSLVTTITFKLHYKKVTAEKWKSKNKINVLSLKINHRPINFVNSDWLFY